MEKVKKILIFDSEIIKAILNKKDEAVPGVQYCKGWTDFKGMGISTVCVYDTKEDKYRVFLADNLEVLQKLINECAFIIGFNNNNFDNKLLAAHGINIPIEKSYDILAEIKKVTGTMKGLGLDALHEANFGVKKDGNGAFAPILWQQKKYGEVIDYCLNDVKMTYNLIYQSLNNGSLIDPRDIEKTISINIPHEIENGLLPF